MYSCDNDEVMMKLFADHGQIESDIRHAYTKTQQNTCKKKKKVFTLSLILHYYSLKCCN